MHVAIIIGGSLVIAGAALYIHHRLTEHTHSEEPEPDVKIEPHGEACCGLHIKCERDSLSPVFGDEIEYFDDEELDVFKDRDSLQYSPEEIEMFRDVLLTLRPEEIAPWARSIQQRGITLPDPVRDELFIIVNEARSTKY